MKDLPSPPPVYVPPKEMWFMRYSVPERATQADMQKTCSAMILTAYAALNMEAPQSVTATVKRVYPLLERFIRSRRGDAMDEWRGICNRLRPDDGVSVESAVIDALKREKQEN